MSILQTAAGHRSVGQSPTLKGPGASQSMAAAGSIDFAQILGGRQALSAASAVIGGASSGPQNFRHAPNAHEFADVSLFGSATHQPLQAVSYQVDINEPVDEATLQPIGADEAGGASGEFASPPGEALGPRAEISSPAQISPGAAAAHGPAAALQGPPIGHSSHGAIAAPSNGAGRLMVQPRRAPASFLSSARAAQPQWRENTATGPFVVSVLLPGAPEGAEIVVRVGGIDADGGIDLARRIRQELTRANLRFSGLTINGRRREVVSKP